MFEAALSKLSENDRDIAASLLKIGIPAALSVACVGIRYCYEFGYCSHFDIPARLIKIETVDVILSTVTFLLIFAVLIVLLREYYLSFFKAIDFPNELRATAVLLLAVLVYYALSSPNLPRLLFLSVACLIVGRNVTSLIGERNHKQGSKERLAKLSSTIGSALLFFVIIYAFEANFKAWSRILIAATPTLFGLIAYTFHKCLPPGKSQAPSQAGSEVEVNSDENEVLAIVFGAAIVLAFMAACVIGYGKRSAMTRTDFPIVQLDQEFAILRSYGDKNYLRLILRPDETCKLGEEYRILTDSELGNQSRSIERIGPFEQVVGHGVPSKLEEGRDQD